jgi:hypothetical protein
VTELILTLLGFGLFGMLCFVCYHAGRSDQKAESFHDEAQINDEAAYIHDRLRRDRLYADRVRNRFTR